MREIRKVGRKERNDNRNTRNLWGIRPIIGLVVDAFRGATILPRDVSTLFAYALAVTMKRLLTAETEQLARVGNQSDGQPKVFDNKANALGRRWIISGQRAANDGMRSRQVS